MDKLKEFGQKVVEYEHIFKILAVIILVITAFLLFGPKGNNETITMDKENVSKNEVISKEEENKPVATRFALSDRYKAVHNVRQLENLRKTISNYLPNPSVNSAILIRAPSRFIS